jgi:hypothetical protein
MALLSASVVQANIHQSPLKAAIDQSVQEAVASERSRGRPRRQIATRPQRLISASSPLVAHWIAPTAEILGGFGAVSNHVEGGMQQAAGAVANQAQGVLQSLGALQQAVGAVTDPLASTATGVAGQVLKDYANMGQYAAQSVRNLGGQFLGSVAGVGSQLSTGYDQLSVVLDAYEQKYCTPAVFTRSESLFQLIRSELVGARRGRLPARPWREKRACPGR